ncbi:hypothetical protein PoB_004469700 [Plakobranchus ocellatus]|uniref:Uncharacterized protein n=1 Tax=Plakobranchus ocellatus TaxID=259542 RepID=A0AAV4BG19_9GAST|nr:hypothetical protein PoB_004469700 [Plakobranchus ocellatus]
MKRLLCWCGDALFITAIFFLVPAAFSMHLVSRNDAGLKRNDFDQDVNYGDQLSRHIEKRQGHDTWGICTYGMSSVDCFFVYLELYAKLNKKARSGGIERIPGKRSLGDDIISTFRDNINMRRDFVISDRHGQRQAFTATHD